MSQRNKNIFKAFIRGLLAFSLIAGLSMVSDAQSQAPQNGLVAHWAFDETEGLTAADSSGNEHNGIAVGLPEWQEGKVNNALRFDGTDDRIQVPYNNAFDLQNGLTLMGWFFAEADPDVGPGNDWRLMIGRSGFVPYGLILEQNGSLHGSVLMNDERQSVLSDTEFPIGEWVHVAYSHNTVTGLARLYINGQLDAEATLSRGAIDTAEGLIRISMPNPEDIDDIHAWNGMVDEVRIYSRALLDAEISLVYNSENNS